MFEWSPWNFSVAPVELPDIHVSLSYVGHHHMFTGISRLSDKNNAVQTWPHHTSTCRRCFTSVLRHFCKLLSHVNKRCTDVSASDWNWLIFSRTRNQLLDNLHKLQSKSSSWLNGTLCPCGKLCFYNPKVTLISRWPNCRVPFLTRIKLKPSTELLCGKCLWKECLNVQSKPKCGGGGGGLHAFNYAEGYMLTYYKVLLRHIRWASLLGTEQKWEI